MATRDYTPNGGWKSDGSQKSPVAKQDMGDKITVKNTNGTKVPQRRKE